MASETPIRLNCPHCNEPVVVQDESENDVVCPVCENSFELDPDRTESWSPEKLPKIGQLDEESPLTLVYMNNHWQGQAVGAARQLRMLMEASEDE